MKVIMFQPTIRSANRACKLISSLQLSLYFPENRNSDNLVDENGLPHEVIDLTCDSSDEVST
jgi:hypothetical protein